jgi:hypothetical protein
VPGSAGREWVCVNDFRYVSRFPRGIVLAITAGADKFTPPPPLWYPPFFYGTYTTVAPAQVPGCNCRCADNGTCRYSAWTDSTLRVFRQNFALEDAIGSHACSLEALACV